MLAQGTLRRAGWRFLVAALASIAGATAAPALDSKPKLGPHAVPLQQSHAYLRGHAAPDYWALSPFYVPQMTDSACSLASLSMLVNALRGLPGISPGRRSAEKSCCATTSSREA